MATPIRVGAVSAAAISRPPDRSLCTTDTVELTQNWRCSGTTDPVTMRTMKRFSCLMLFLAALPATAQPTITPDALGERLTACAACHGKSGEGMAGSEYYPHLAGKPAHYLFKQLRAFRDGDRPYAQMRWLLRNMDDTYLEQIAAHFAAMPPRTRDPDAVARPLPAETTQRARQLVHDGDAAQGVPACAACHGDNLAGLEPGIPALVGLPEEYIVAQFGGWISRVRKAEEPDCMAQIARALDPRDIRAVAAWLAQQDSDQPHRPAPAGSFTPPRACGGMPSAPVQP
jgi:cytochrome c553